ncbi:hypothetical protein THAOC_11298 [Thalassiosira oceanica]|uniref:Uncharacterized protein n=1 Tax=Thalassiosira oceanica TaxID=159749 RepID=K0T2X1_THAOC|nr:hypothetical protein THAOC_11298 [Thalassiosira oceanica]|eukprot:EJK67641.1 hypothetical protein THAOC_11298 [Thalassiosira oceanica]
MKIAISAALLASTTIARASVFNNLPTASSSLTAAFVGGGSLIGDNLSGTGDELLPGEGRPPELSHDTSPGRHGAPIRGIRDLQGRLRPRLGLVRRRRPAGVRQAPEDGRGVRHGRARRGLPLPRVRRVLRQRAGGRQGHRGERREPRRALPLQQGLDHDHREGGRGSKGPAREDPVRPRDGLRRPVPDPLAGAGEARRGLQDLGKAQGRGEGAEHRRVELRRRGLQGAHRGRRHGQAGREPDRDQPLPLPEEHHRLLQGRGRGAAVVPVAPRRQGHGPPVPRQDREGARQVPGAGPRTVVRPARLRLHPQVGEEGAHGRERRGVRLRALGRGDGGARRPDGRAGVRGVRGPVPKVRQQGHDEGRDDGGREDEHHAGLTGTGAVGRVRRAFLFLPCRGMEREWEWGWDDGEASLGCAKKE